MHSFVELLKKEFEVRKQKNPKYSQRAFARDLGVSSGRLTNLLLNKAIPGEKIISRIITKLDVSIPALQKIKHERSHAKYITRGKGFSKVVDATELEQLSQWETWAIFTLMQMKQFDGSVTWLQKKTGFETITLGVALKRLQKINFVTYDKKTNTYSLIIRNFTTSTDVPSQTIRSLHKQFLSRALHTLDKIEPLQRDFTSITMCINPAKLPDAKKLIAEFRGKINKLMEDESTSELYQLNVQLFPLTIKHN